jgi:tetratricopeptide (TPR) repeat protein
MIGFAWLELRQAREALKCGRFEEAHRLLCQPAACGHKRSWEMLVEITRGLVERGDKYLRQNDSAAAWNDLLAAEQVGVSDIGVDRLRQALTRLGLAEVRSQLEAGEPTRAAEAITQLRNRSVGGSELQALDDGAKSWTLACEQAARGEFSQALQTMGRVRKLFPNRLDAVEQYIAVLEQRHQSFANLLVQLHAAADQRDWREVVRLSEQVLSMAPQHFEARKARALAWRAIEPQTIASVPRSEDPAAVPKDQRDQRFLLWVDGVGGFLVCLGNRVTLGQATPDAYVDIPLFADVSRVHAALNRDSEGYVLEATRSVLINNQPADKALLQSGDRITLGGSCQIQFRQPVPVSATARLDIVSGHRLPLTVDGVLLMADTLVLGPGTQVHVAMPELSQPIVLYRQKDGLGVRYTGDLYIDGQHCHERGSLRPNSTVTGEDFAFAIEPVGTGMGRM